MTYRWLDLLYYVIISALRYDTLKAYKHLIQAPEPSISVSCARLETENSKVSYK